MFSLDRLIYIFRKIFIFNNSSKFDSNSKATNRKIKFSIKPMNQHSRNYQRPFGDVLSQIHKVRLSRSSRGRNKYKYITDSLSTTVTYPDSTTNLIRNRDLINFKSGSATKDKFWILKKIYVENSNIKDNLGKLAKSELGEKITKPTRNKAGLGGLAVSDLTGKMMDKGKGLNLNKMDFKNPGAIKDNLNKRGPKALKAAQDNLSKPPKLNKENLKDGLERLKSSDMKDKLKSKGTDLALEKIDTENLGQISESVLKKKIKKTKEMDTGLTKTLSSATISPSSTTNDTQKQLSAFKDLDEQNKVTPQDFSGGSTDDLSFEPRPTLLLNTTTESSVGEQQIDKEKTIPSENSTDLTSSLESKDDVGDQLVHKVDEGKKKKKKKNESKDIKSQNKSIIDDNLTTTSIEEEKPVQLESNEKSKEKRKSVNKSAEIIRTSKPNQNTEIKGDDNKEILTTAKIDKLGKQTMKDQDNIKETEIPKDKNVNKNKNIKKNKDDKKHRDKEGKKDRERKTDKNKGGQKDKKGKMDKDKEATKVKDDKNVPLHKKEISIDKKKVSKKGKAFSGDSLESTSSGDVTSSTSKAVSSKTDKKQKKKKGKDEVTHANLNVESKQTQVQQISTPPQSPEMISKTPENPKDSLDTPGKLKENLSDNAEKDDKNQDDILDLFTNQIKDLRNINLGLHCRMCESIYDTCCNCGCLMDENRMPLSFSKSINHKCVCLPLKKSRSMTICRPRLTWNCKSIHRNTPTSSESFTLSCNCIDGDLTYNTRCPQKVICIS